MWLLIFWLHRHGHWFHQQLLARSLSLFNERELLELERELQSKLSDVQVSFVFISFLVRLIHNC